MKNVTTLALAAALVLSVPAIAWAKAITHGAAPTLSVDDSIVLAQTSGMDRRQERRDERQARRADRRERLEVRIDCGATDIILEEEQAEAVAATISITGTTREEVAAGLCELISDVDASGYENPTNATIQMPSGVELFVELHASQQ